MSRIREVRAVFPNLETTAAALVVASQSRAHCLTGNESLRTKSEQY